MRLLIAAIGAAALLGTAFGVGSALPPAQAASAPAASSTAAHLRSGSAPLDSADAWYFCRSEVYRFSAGTRPRSDPFTVNPYAARFIERRAHGRWKVQLVGRLGQGVEAGSVNAAWCVVGGTVAHPQVRSYLYPR